MSPTKIEEIRCHFSVFESPAFNQPRAKCLYCQVARSDNVARMRKHLKRCKPFQRAHPGREFAEPRKFHKKKVPKKKVPPTSGPETICGLVRDFKALKKADFDTLGAYLDQAHHLREQLEILGVELGDFFSAKVIIKGILDCNYAWAYYLHCKHTNEKLTYSEVIDYLTVKAEKEERLGGGHGTR